MKVAPDPTVLPKGKSQARSVTVNSYPSSKSAFLAHVWEEWRILAWIKPGTFFKKLHTSSNLRGRPPRIVAPVTVHTSQ